MTIHKFGDDVGQIKSDGFVAGHAQFRSDIEQQHNALSIHADDSNDLRIVRDRADEMINTIGADAKVYIRTDNADFDHVWDSDPDPTYWQAAYIKAFFKPTPLETELKRWGPDIVNKAEVVFSFRQVYSKFGDRMLRTGDVIVLPYNSTPTLSPRNYRILNATPSGNFRFHWLYITCTCETLTADITVRPENDMAHIQDDEKGIYYEGS